MEQVTKFMKDGFNFTMSQESRFTFRGRREITTDQSKMWFTTVRDAGQLRRRMSSSGTWYSTIRLTPAEVLELPPGHDALKKFNDFAGFA